MTGSGLLRRASLAGAGVVVIATLGMARTAQLDMGRALILGGLLLACVAGFILAVWRTGSGRKEP